MTASLQTQLFFDLVFKVLAHFLGTVKRKDRAYAVQCHSVMTTARTMRHKDGALFFKPPFEFAVLHDSECSDAD